VTRNTANAILADLERFGIRLGLEGPRGLLAALGDPQVSLPAVLVAGTNGKGSTSALLAAMATAAGYRTGLYTSPHLESVEERLRLDGVAVSPERLGDLLARVVAAAGERPPTYFEAMTVAAFLDFAERGVDLAVLEVGMGGRLDATNLAEPRVSAIAPIGLDHTEHLGPTLAAIAREKAGVLRMGKPAVAWVEAPEAAEALAQAARETGADLRFANREVEIESIEPRGREGQRVALATPQRRYELEVALLGRHQAENLALAVATAEALANQGFPQLDADAVARGAAACRWPGRLESIDLPDGRRVLLDAAHNPDGAAALAEFLAEEGEHDLLFGVLADKDAANMLPPLARTARRVVLTGPPSPRALAPESLAALLHDSRAEILIEADPARALDRALENAGRELIVCGSIFLIGEIRHLLRQRFGVPLPARATPTYVAAGS
jgi:dihydrofolate synthase / folylpolyglutamate synthase